MTIPEIQRVILMVMYGFDRSAPPATTPEFLKALNPSVGVETIVLPVLQSPGDLSTALLARIKQSPSVVSVIFVPNDAALTASEFPRLSSLVNAVSQQAHHVFLLVFSSIASMDPKLRYSLCSDSGAHMVSHMPEHCMRALQRIADESNKGKLTCEVCGKSSLTPEELWYHVPLFHVNTKKSISLSEVNCPICGMGGREAYAVHIHNEHPPLGQSGEVPRSNLPLVAFGLCVIQRKSDNKFLVVQEYENQGYWLPGGGIDASEMPDAAAVRECIEEAGIHPILTGLLRVEVSPHSRYVRTRYIFYGHPRDENEQCKTFPDFESVGACWVSLEDLEKPGIEWRGSEPHEWFRYVAAGGHIAPISMLTREGAPAVVPPAVVASRKSEI